MTLLRTLLGSAMLMPIMFQANAQSVPNVDPGKIQQRFEQQERPTLQQEGVVPNVAKPEPSAQMDASASFELKSITLQGNTVFSENDLKSLYESKIGGKATLADVQAIAEAITAKYRNAGYILSRAAVPAQRISSGDVTIQIVEGYVDSVNFQGEVPENRWLINQYADNITAARPLNVKALERYLLLMNDLAGLTARGALSPSPAAQGGSVLTVTLDQRKYDGTIGVDNRGSRYLGPLQGNVMLRTNSLLGLHERVMLRTIDTLNLDELRYHELSYEQPLGSEGTRLRVLGSVTDTEPGGNLKALDVEGDSSSIVLEATHPFLRTRRENLFGTFGFTYRDTSSDVLNTNVYDDHVRQVHAGVAYDFVDGLEGITQLSGMATQGLDMLGANDQGDLISRGNADRDFTKFNIDASRLQSFNQHWGLQLNASVQYSLDPLYSSEEFSIGEFYGSAYDAAELSGDHGIAGRAELQYNGDSPAEWVDSWQLYTFIDGGKIWNKDSQIGEEDNASLVSSGVGLRTEIFKQWRAGLELAVPMTRDVAAEGSDGEDARIFFRVSYDLP